MALTGTLSRQIANLSEKKGRGANIMRIFRIVLLSCMIGVFFISSSKGQWVRVLEYYGNVGCFLTYSNGPTSTHILAGTDGGGIQFSSDYGASWSVRGMTDTSVLCFASGENGTNIFAGTYGEGVFRSDDYGVNWTAHNDGLDTAGDKTVRALAVAPNGLGGINVFAGTDGGFFLSTSYGETWVHKDLPYITAIALSDYGPGGMRIYAAAYANGVYVSNDLGTNWRDISHNLSYRNINVLARGKIESADTTLFCANGGNYLFRSTSSGSSWTTIDYNNGLANGGVCALAMCADAPDKIFAGTSGGGVFLSTDNGTSWTAQNTGLTNTDIRSLIITDDGAGGRYLFAGTINGGIWRRALSEMVTSVRVADDNIPQGFILEQNYPNPFNPKTVIRYSVPHRTVVRIRIIDMLGREVRTIINGEKSAGQYEIEFDARTLPSGLYFYQLKADNFLQTKKLVLLN